MVASSQQGSGSTLHAFDGARRTRIPIWEFFGLTLRVHKQSGTSVVYDETGGLGLQSKQLPCFVAAVLRIHSFQGIGWR